MLVLIRKNLRELFKNKRKVSLLLGLPIVFFGLLTGLYSGTSLNKEFIQPVRIGVIDLDQSVFSRLLLDHYKKNTVFTDFMTMISGNGEEIEEAFNNGELDAFIEIPEKFADQLIRMSHMPIEVKISTEDPVKAIIIKNILVSYEKYIQAVERNVTLLYDTMLENKFSTQEVSAANAEISYELIMTAMERNTFFEYIQLIDIPNTSSLNYFFTAILTLLIMYFGLYVGLDLLKERHQQTLQRLQVIGYSRITFIVSKLISHVIYLFGLIILWLVGIFYMMKVPVSLVMVIFLLCSIIFTVSFSIFISSLFMSEESILLIGNIFYFLSAVIGGSIIPLQFLPENVRFFSKLTPNYWIIKGLLYVQQGIQSNLPYYVMTALLSLAVLLIGSAQWGYKRLGDCDA